VTGCPLRLSHFDLLPSWRISIGIGIRCKLLENYFGRKPVIIRPIRQAKTVRTTAFFGLRQTQLTGWLGLMAAGFLWATPALTTEEVQQDAPGGEEAPKLYLPPEPTRPYLDAIDRIEEERGPYATDLSDLYLGLGEEFLKNGEFEEARDAYHRGVMVVRVNAGPNSPEQTNLLYLIANIETILEEPKQADKILENIRFVNTQFYGEDSPELLPVYERMYEWYHTARPLDLDESKYEDYMRLIDLTDEMKTVSESALGPSHPDTLRAYRRLAEAHFQAMRFAVHEEEWIEPRIIVASDIPYQTIAGFDEMSMREHYTDGRDAFRRYIELLEADPATTSLEHAEALADLGDWSLHFEKYRSARNLYEQAYQVLAASDDYAELVDNYLGSPKPMKFVDIYRVPIEGAPLESEEQRVDVSMTVTRIGDVRYVEILNPPEDMSEDNLKEIKRELQDTPFRPSLKDGKAVTTEGFIWQHVIRAEPPSEPPEEIQAEERTS